VPVETLLQILGIVAWGLWAYLVLAIVLAFLAEAATRGRLRAGPALVTASGLVVPKALRRLVELAVGGVFVAASISGNLGLKAEGHQVAAVVSVDQTVPASSVKGGATEVPKKSTYRVRSGDSLWRIAERELGSGFRWREIYRLNRGRSFGNGHRLTHPHVIYSGWVLDLPRGGGKISGADRNGRDERLADKDPPPQEGQAVAPSPATVEEVSRGGETVEPTPNIDESEDLDREVPRRPVVRLPSGILVATSFASGLLTAHLLGRLRQRRSRRISEVEPPEQPQPELTDDFG
jgi:hypothetical protein